MHKANPLQQRGLRIVYKDFLYPKMFLVSPRTILCTCHCKPACNQTLPIYAHFVVKVTTNHATSTTSASHQALINCNQNNCLLDRYFNFMNKTYTQKAAKYVQYKNFHNSQADCENCKVINLINKIWILYVSKVQVHTRVITKNFFLQIFQYHKEVNNFNYSPL